MSSNLIPREAKVKMLTNGISGINLTLVKENPELKKQLALMQDNFEYASIVEQKKGEIPGPKVNQQVRRNEKKHSWL